MKKIILMVVSLVFVASLFAGASGEAYLQYPLIGYPGAADEDGGLVGGYVGIGYWGADYGFHFNFRDTAYPGDNWTINHMFKKFTLHPMVNLLVGKTAVPLVKQLNPSGFANVNIIEGGCWSFINPENNFMLKLDGNVSGLGWQLYTANVNLSNSGGWDYADYGLRLDYTVAGVEIGAGLKMIGVPEEEDSMMDWAFDLGYTAAEMVNFELQLLNSDDANDDTSDLNLYFVTHYVPGFKGITPYLGYFSHDGLDNEGLLQAMEENVMFFGLNMNPTKDSVLKLEYKMYSLEMLDENEDDYNADTLTLELGFSF
ncbi:MAG: hypothetical protein K9N07_05205 [Candidatus Cloacimonetes bacterium]|nr:hypothetical protein [Candidatus Cloacimonadota bacterium]